MKAVNTGTVQFHILCMDTMQLSHPLNTDENKVTENVRLINNNCNKVCD